MRVRDLYNWDRLGTDDPGSALALFCKLFNANYDSKCMGGIRVDHVSGRFMIVRDVDGDGTDGADSVYAPGNEEHTSPSVLSLVVKDGIMQRHQDLDEQIVRDWSVRVFEASKPIVSVAADTRYGAAPFESMPAYGYHYVVVASPDPASTLATIDVDQWSNILVVVQDRLRWLYEQRGVSYVAIYADHDAGAPKTSPHLNLVSFKTIPALMEREMDSHRYNQEKRGTCPVCVEIEGGETGERRVLQTEHFAAYCPWSPSYPFEFCIAPRRHAVSFAKISQKDIDDLALMMRATLGGLVRMLGDGVSYSIAFHLSAERKSSRQVHWHVEVYPATKPWSGLERGYGIHLCDVSPEDAARRLGRACKQELASMVGIE